MNKMQEIEFQAPILNGLEQIGRLQATIFEQDPILCGIPVLASPAEANILSATYLYREYYRQMFRILYLYDNPVVEAYVGQEKEPLEWYWTLAFFEAHWSDSRLPDDQRLTVRFNSLEIQKFFSLEYFNQELTTGNPVDELVMRCCKEDVRTILWKAKEPAIELLEDNGIFIPWADESSPLT